MVDRKTANLIEGTPSEMVQYLREQYAKCMLPRHPKKSVEQAFSAEVQGAWVDGVRGTLCAKPSKVAKYSWWRAGVHCHVQLASLNQIWQMIVDAEADSPWKRRWLRREMMVELVRCIGLCPLAFMDLRYPFDEMVTASDASNSGGGHQP